MYVPEEYPSDMTGFYLDEQHKNTLQPASSSTQKAILTTTKKRSTSSKKSSKSSSTSKDSTSRTD